MAHATPEDVSNRLGRPFNPGEETRVEAFLEDAEAEVLRKAPNILTDVETDEALSQRLKSVECSVVLRAARLPNSLDQVVPAIEGTGYSSVPQTQGAIYLRRSEMRSLGIRLTGVASMTPYPDPTIPGHEPGWPDPDWSWY
jgi:hypothetical protein